jgi:hypothetical protein
VTHVVLLPALKILFPSLPSALSQCFLRFLYVTAHSNKFSISLHSASCFAKMCVYRMHELGFVVLYALSIVCSYSGQSNR